ncbi:hypothetical protein Goari_016161 [Gossypium aridum]|uniref:DUF4283 domain-containing protein n=1 Tax=Gossypium aridum TaxID=34290 RepID=A0A7J8WI48_GOSAI|nr:hypothetical protein [Gossypium aridum]
MTTEDNLAALRIAEAKEDVIHLLGLSTGRHSLYEFCFVDCFATASVPHVPAMRNTLTNLWHPLGGIQITDLGEDPLLVPLIYSYFWVQVHNLPLGLFLKAVAQALGNFVGFFEEYNVKQAVHGVAPFLRGQLGHGDSFCPIRLVKEVTADDMGWDISLRAVGRRAAVMDITWL